MLYLPRDYLYLKHIFYDDKYSCYILDKSVVLDDYKPNYKTIRGEIEYCIT